MANVFISGASRGIGLALAGLYAGNGDTVVGNGRSDAAEASFDNFTYVGVDSRALNRHRLVAAGLERLDVLILNAAVFGPTGRPDAAEVDVDRLAEVIEINALSQLRLLQTALPLLYRAPAPRVAMLVSKGGRQSGMTGPGSIYYRTSKACQLAMGLNLAHSLKEDGVIFRMINPGSTQTRIGGKAARMTPEESAGRVRSLIDSASLEDDALCLDFDGKPLKL